MTVRLSVPADRCRASVVAASFAGLGLLGALAGCAATQAEQGSSTGDDSGTTGSSAAPVEEENGSEDATSGYADGEYTADGSYISPGGQESITVDLTVADGVVTDVTVTPHATSGNSKQYQTQFASGIADAVVGKELATLSVDRVAGSSLTGGGFNAALDEIRADAAE